MAIEIFTRSSGKQSSGKPPETAAPAPSIQQIVATVRQPSPLKLALQTWQALQKSYGAASDELRQAITAMQAAGGETAATAAPLVRRVTELDRRLRALREQIGTALQAVIDARPEYVAAVVSALRPARRAAAKTALKAIEELNNALQVLDEVDAEIAAIGGNAARPLPQHRAVLRPMIVRLRKLAE
jgi:hypothetical protein